MNTFQKYLPSKKFMIAIASIVIIIIVIFLVKYFSQQRASSLPDITVGDVVAQDSDNDGIPDWQERLYETNQNRLDAPNSTTTPITPTDTAATPATYTDQLTQDFFIAFNALSQGQTLDPIAQQNLTEQLSSYIADVSSTKTWTSSDITVTGNDITNLERYVSAYSVFVKLYKPLTNPVNILETSIYSNNPSKLDELNELIEHHTGAITGLSRMVVPQRALPYHLDMMNAIQNLLDDTVGIQQYFSDPLLTFSAIFLYNEHIQDFINATTRINENFFIPIAQDELL